MAKDNTSKSSQTTSPTEPTSVSDVVQETTPPKGAGTVVSESPTPKPEPRTFAERREKARTSPNETLRGYVAFLDSYEKAMAPSVPASVDVVIRQQRLLWDQLRYIVESSPADQFRETWSFILNSFNALRGQPGSEGLLHETYVFRGADLWKQSPEQLLSFQQLLNLIGLTRAAKDRANYKNFSFEKNLRVLSDAGRQRLLSFYTAN